MLFVSEYITIVIPTNKCKANIIRLKSLIYQYVKDIENKSKFSGSQIAFFEGRWFATLLE